MWGKVTQRSTSLCLGGNGRVFGQEERQECGEDREKRMRGEKSGEGKQREQDKQIKEEEKES